jgi:hypothetical protein
MTGIDILIAILFAVGFVLLAIIWSDIGTARRDPFDDSGEW